MATSAEIRLQSVAALRGGPIGPGNSDDCPLVPDPEGLCLRRIARLASSKLRYPSDQLSLSLVRLNRRQPAHQRARTGLGP